MKELRGKDVSTKLEEKLMAEVAFLKSKNIFPTLAVILVGNDPASKVYVGHKAVMCKSLGIVSIEKKLPENCSQEELLEVIDQLNNDSTIHGILCQLPLPKQCDEHEVINRIDPRKDVDCFHPYNLGLLTAGTPRFIPCTPYGVIEILKHNHIELNGKEIVIVGRSNIVGRPLSILLSLKGYDATVTLCHSGTKQLDKVCKRADILITAVGKPKQFGKKYVKDGATVIDIGINRISDPTTKSGFRLVGDVDYEDIADVAGAATPVPGGVGPMTIIMLMYNTINATRGLF